MSDTRAQLLQKLLEHKDYGLTTDELSQELGITRTGVQQHLVTLERDGMVRQLGSRSTGGRPSRAYGLSERGYEEFPRSYELLAQGLLATAAEALGEEAVERLLARLADKLAQQSLPALSGLKGQERVRAVAELMTELGYDARLLGDGEGIAAANCVYHKVAKQTRAVCRFDVRLLSSLLGEGVSHRNCMLDGHACCTFELAGNEGRANGAQGPAGGEPANREG